MTQLPSLFTNIPISVGIVNSSRKILQAELWTVWQESALKNTSFMALSFPEENDHNNSFRSHASAVHQGTNLCTKPHGYLFRLESWVQQICHLHLHTTYIFQFQNIYPSCPFLSFFVVRFALLLTTFPASNRLRLDIDSVSNRTHYASPFR